MIETRRPQTRDGVEQVRQDTRRWSLHTLVTCR
jgi:hypothetical protein